jgi:putative ABC transport system substrate-binding protein
MRGARLLPCNLAHKPILSVANCCCNHRTVGANPEPEGKVRRRDFIRGIAGSTVVWPLAVRAQQPGKLPTIGFLGTSAASSWSAWTAAFEQRLGELGWTEGRTVAIEYRWGEGSTERFAEIAAEFVKIRADVIVTAGSAVPAIKQATSAIPIVFAIATDPVGGE